MTVLTETCACRQMMPMKQRVVDMEDGVVTRAVVPAQRDISPGVHVEVKDIQVGVEGMTVLSYTCEWCGKELGQYCLGGDGGQTNLFGGPAALFPSRPALTEK